ncbi:MAG: SprT-like domain-containing protein [Gemmatimonadaceae bacterium]
MTRRGGAPGAPGAITAATGAQLALALDAPLRTAEELLARLTTLGLVGIARCRLTQNRTMMVSFSRGVLRVHRAYLDAPEDVLHAIARFVSGRTRADRRAARRTLLAFPIPPSAEPRARRPERRRPGDDVLARELADWHRDYNARYFDRSLAEMPIRVSGRMRRRLGQYTIASPLGGPAEIVLSRAHIKRHGWSEALHTLLHEMIHQWQAETGVSVDHGRAFRRKAREVGVAPRARRVVGQPAPSLVGDVSRHDPTSRAAREE